MANHNDDYARYMQIDGHPDHPKILAWSMTEQERIEMQTLEALAASNWGASQPPPLPPLMSVAEVEPEETSFFGCLLDLVFG